MMKKIEVLKFRDYTKLMDFTIPVEDVTEMYEEINVKGDKETVIRVDKNRYFVKDEIKLEVIVKATETRRESMLIW
jgi:hypothetical protein